MRFSLEFVLYELKDKEICLDDERDYRDRGWKLFADSMKEFKFSKVRSGTILMRAEDAEDIDKKEV